VQTPAASYSARASFYLINYKYKYPYNSQYVADIGQYDRLITNKSKVQLAWTRSSTTNSCLGHYYLLCQIPIVLLQFSKISWMDFVKAKLPLKGGRCGRCPDVEKLESTFVISGHRSRT
jgi:hypothetical protein